MENERLINVLERMATALEKIAENKSSKFPLFTYSQLPNFNEDTAFYKYRESNLPETTLARRFPMTSRSLNMSA